MNQIIINQLTRHLKRKELALFCGAGISIPSGIPGVGSYIDSCDKIVDGITPRILEQFDFSSDEIKSFLSAHLPFEAFIEHLIEYGLDLNKIVSIFDSKPNNYHRAIAYLTQKGLISKIVTTNFDQCIEKALGYYDKLSLIPNINDYFSNHSKLPLKYFAKVHGCLSEPSNLAITIKEISKRKNQQRNRLINNIFQKSATHNAVLIVGYSCSDHFDITPQIQYLITKRKRNLCKVIYWEYEYATTPKIVHFKDINANARYLFKGHPNILKVKGDLNMLISQIPNFTSTELTYSNHWDETIKTYFNNHFTDIERLIIKASLLQRIDEFNVAKNIYSSIINTDNTPKNIAVSLENKGTILRIQGKYEEALALHKQAEYIYRCELNENVKSADSIESMGIAYKCLGKYEESITCHTMAESILIQENDLDKLARNYGSKALTLKLQGQLNEALKLHEKECAIHIEIGNKIDEAKSYSNQSAIYRNIWSNTNDKKMLNKAIFLLETSKKIFEKFGYESASAYGSLGILYAESNRLRLSLSSFKKSKSICRQNNLQRELIAVYANEGNLLAKYFHKKEDGIKLVKKAIALCRKIKDGREKPLLELLEEIKNNKMPNA